jgi:hypothetical protein
MTGSLLFSLVVVWHGRVHMNGQSSLSFLLISKYSSIILSAVNHCVWIQRSYATITIQLELYVFIKFYLILKESVLTNLCLVVQELQPLPEHPSSPPTFSGVCVSRSLVFMCMFCRLLFVLFLKLTATI